MIVVTGAAGRLGRLVVRLLVDKGYDVLATDRVAFDESPAEFVHADLGDPSSVGRILKGAEAVIHMGAIPGPTRDEPREREKDDRGPDQTDAIESERLEVLDRKLDDTEVDRPNQDGPDERSVDG